MADEKPADVAKPAEEKPADPKPATPGQVKGNPMNHPAIIPLQKKLAEQQDTIDALTGEVDDLKKFLQDANLGGPPGPGLKRIPVVDPSQPAPAAANDLDSFLWGQK